MSRGQNYPSPQAVGAAAGTGGKGHSSSPTVDTATAKGTRGQGHPLPSTWTLQQGQDPGTPVTQKRVFGSRARDVYHPDIRHPQQCLLHQGMGPATSITPAVDTAAGTWGQGHPSLPTVDGAAGIGSQEYPSLPTVTTSRSTHHFQQ